ncbi:hypothetical protein LHGZ1_2546 [Laribacter hongkongensis]|uniref:Uncharacterized protein n=1 Tax=Laribacter hongkongensis TaxID=168471 RepID=A0A248LKT8_9NEIS|nr:hypothetical protein LHGZ1_2546 [Laribacter hongkongensis]
MANYLKTCLFHLKNHKSGTEVEQRKPCLTRVCGLCSTVPPVPPLFCISMGVSS